MAEVKYTLSRRVVSGSSEVMVRFYAGRGVDFRAKSHIFVPVEFWDNFTGNLAFARRLSSPRVNYLIETESRLNRLKIEILDSFLQMRPDGRDSSWLQGVVDRFADPSAARGTHIPVSEVVDMYLEASDVSSGTIRQYKVLARMLDRYAHARATLYIDTITQDDLDDLSEWMSCEERIVKGNGVSVVRRCNNTISTKFKRLRAVCNWAERKHLTKESPFFGYSIPEEVYGTPIFLTTAERDAVAAFDGLSPALSVQRDIFVFQCHIGCRVSDLYELTADNVTEDGFLQYIPVKTIRRQIDTIRVPLDDVAAQLVERYRSEDRASLFPFIAYANYNAAIKDVLRIAGIDRPVLVLNKLTLQYDSVPIWRVASTHLARKTFIEAMFKATRSERITSSFTGHSANSKAFSRYSDVDDEMKLSIISDMSRKQ